MPQYLVESSARPHDWPVNHDPILDALADPGWISLPGFMAPAEARMLAQTSREERQAIATHVIENDGTLEQLRARVEEVYRALTRG